MSIRCDSLAFNGDFPILLLKNLQFAKFWDASYHLAVATAKGYQQNAYHISICERESYDPTFSYG